jgi:hypothetical protein
MILSYTLIIIINEFYKDTEWHYITIAIKTTPKDKFIVHVHNCMYTLNVNAVVHSLKQVWFFSIFL